MTRSAFLSIAAAFVAAFLLAVGLALAHEPYTGQKDPIYRRDGTMWTQAQSSFTSQADPYQGCCSGNDCKPIPRDMVSHVIEAVDGGYIVRMTAEEAQRINPHTHKPVDAFIPRERVKQLTPEMEIAFHICLWEMSRDAPHYGVICFWEPPNT